MTMTFIAIVILLACLGGSISRAVGGDLPLPRWLALSAYSLLYGVVFLGHPVGLIAMAAAGAAKSTGHTPYWFLGRAVPGWDGSAPAVDSVVRFFFGPLTRRTFWRDLFGLILTGLMVTVVPAILFAWYADFFSAALILFSGALKPLGYMLGWKLADLGKTHNPNEYGEFLTGFFGWGILALCI